MADKELKKKKKQWFSIVATKEFNQMKLGETLAAEANDVIGRRIQVNLLSLTNEPKKQNFNLLFEIEKVEGTNAHTKLLGYYMNQAYLKRMVRKGVQKIEDSFFVTTKDNVKMAVKPVFVTKAKVQRSVATKLRKIAREQIDSMAKNLETTELFLSVISNKLQMALKDAFKKVYPVYTSEIRILEKV